MCLSLASIVEKPSRPKSPGLRAERRSSML
jgi:hypothetical protein